MGKRQPGSGIATFVLAIILLAAALYFFSSWTIDHKTYQAAVSIGSVIGSFAFAWRSCRTVEATPS